MFGCRGPCQPHDCVGEEQPVRPAHDRKSADFFGVESHGPVVIAEKGCIGLSRLMILRSKTGKTRCQESDSTIDMDGVSERVNDLAKTPCDLVKLYSGCSEPEC